MWRGWGSAAALPPQLAHVERGSLGRASRAYWEPVFIVFSQRRGGRRASRDRRVGEQEREPSSASLRLAAGSLTGCGLRATSPPRSWGRLGRLLMRASPPLPCVGQFPRHAFIDVALEASTLDELSRASRMDMGCSGQTVIEVASVRVSPPNSFVTTLAMLPRGKPDRASGWARSSARASTSSAVIAGWGAWPPVPNTASSLRSIVASRSIASLRSCSLTASSALRLAGEAGKMPLIAHRRAARIAASVAPKRHGSSPSASASRSPALRCPDNEPLPNG